jgi:hypothetical protein
MISIKLGLGVVKGFTWNILGKCLTCSSGNESMSALNPADATRR